jgi:hypothetical protein
MSIERSFAVWLCALLIAACGSSGDSERDAGQGGPARDAGDDLDAAGEGERDAAPSGDAAPAGDAATSDAGSEADASRGDAGSGCRASSECEDFELCVGPDERLCGVAPREECSSDEECGEGVCHAISDACSPDGIGSSCGPSCAEAGCEAGFACKPSGRCEPIACGDSLACPASETCDPSSIDESAAPHAITHGCVVIVCTNDEPCPGETSCVNGRCQTGLGECSLPPP